MMNVSIDAVKTIVSRYHSEQFCVKDNQSRYIDGNESWLSFFGYSRSEQVYQKTDYDLPCADYAPQYIYDDQEAMHVGEIQVIEPTIKHNGEFHVLLTKKYQLYDEITKSSGIVAFSKIIDINTVKKLLPIFERNNFSQLKINNALFNSKVNQFAKMTLTERELDVFYYLLHGLSQKQIADKLNLSVRTVEDYVDHIKTKLNCANKYQLFEFAIHHGLMNIIPKHMLNEAV